MTGGDAPRWREIEVPHKPAPPSRDVVEFVDHLLTRLLQEDARVLLADFDATGGRWFIRQTQSDLVVEQPIMAPDERARAYFRSILARFGFHYMNVQMYGGYAEVILRQLGRVSHCAIYMGNEGWRGHWIRIQAR